MRGGGGGRGARSYDDEIAWSSINRSVLFSSHDHRYSKYSKTLFVPVLEKLNTRHFFLQ
jgi:hypothetical protein